MTKLILFLTAIFALTLFVSTSLSLEHNVGVDNLVINELNHNEQIPVVIELGSTLQATQDIAVNSIISKIKDGEIERLDGNKIIATISADDLESLEESWNVGSIRYNYGIQTLLQDSLGIINATSVYSRQANLSNITGAGETICVIDTGINYTHPDFGSCSNNSFANGSCGKVLGGFDYGNNDADPMDADGHGTHVAGIVAANGTIKGVAPDAQLVVLKVFSDAGSGSSANVENAIRWCVNNATVYNISVITMSLGLTYGNSSSVTKTKFCDNDDATLGNLTLVINNATARNISVMIATGNDGATGAVGAPACIENATAVGATNKDDTFASYGNRMNITDLVAPGTNINSTRLNSGSCSSGCTCNGNYMVCSGTSMATPHAAGAFALLRQFKKQQGAVLNQTSLYGIINKTGKILFDSGSGLNYSRIDLLSAIITYDTAIPNISLVSPASGYNTLNNTNITFRCNASDVELKNVSFQTYNTTGVFTTQNRNLTGIFTQLEFNITIIPVGSYNWSCIFADYANNTATAVNRSFVVGSIVTTLTSPANGTATAAASRNFTCNSTSVNNNLSNITFYVWNATALLESNQTASLSGVSNETTFNFTLPHNGAFDWNCLTRDTANLNTFALTNNTISLDTTAPNVSVTAPTNGSFLNAGRFNVSINEDGNCTYSLNRGRNNISITTSDNRSFTAVNTTGFAQDSVFNVTYYCNDTLGNLNATTPIFFTIDLTAPNVSLSSPADNANPEAGSVSFQFTAVDNLNINSCSVIINGTANAVVLNTSSIQSGTNTIARTMSAGTYNWRINCTDSVGNTGTATARYLNVTATSSSSSSSTTTGGAAAAGSAKKVGKTFVLTETQVEKGYNSNDLASGDKLKIPFKNETHVLEVTAVDNTAKKTTFTVSSKTQTFTLGVEETAKADVDEDKFYDLAITVKSILTNNTSFYVKEIHEEVKISATASSGSASEQNNNTVKNESNITGKSVSNGSRFGKISRIDIYFGAIVLYIIGVAIYLGVNYAKRRKKT